MKPQDFDFLSSLLKRRSGLTLNPDKVYLLESRLTPLARRSGMDSLDALIAELRRSGSETLLRDVTEAMTTNESFFFRDRTPFDLFRDQVLPMLYQRRSTTKKIRIWCAACSTGQEPYSLAFELKKQEAKWRDWSIEIVGTDISRPVLQKARDGVYSQFEVQRGLPIQLLMKHFTQEGDIWRLSEDIRKMVTFREFNLLDNFAALGKFDVIYCRNVLIYFDQPTKSNVLDRMRGLLPTDGTLFLGAAETVLGITDRFRPVRGQRGMYLPSDAEPNLMAAVGG
ncbi:chemotaxis protein CheR [Iodidimonas nitroreducens]|uniref:protein-glutamate O-methyltransferase n=1 Tax=Iodidimonas nitroreducens TaxID=1236968 RepID=A0A5A7NBG1_9PROT|nr:protein-glutamate O-methyltransferase [Iodidimonas nitroreducens]GAK33142.1 chemotaxis protein methyltransferase Cher2 [alpha proteobacterium Q-1]GER05054.1 chemotaxis protein CheR [Iodidimonas nitroreducens]